MQLFFGIQFLLMRRAPILDVSHSFHRETAPTGHGLFREESRTVSRMASGAMHQAGSQGVTVPNLMHPRPTFNMGWDKGGILPLIQSQEV
jgi:hypothetical protein